MSIKADTFVNLPDFLAQQYAGPKSESTGNTSSFANMLHDLQPTNKPDSHIETSQPASSSRPKVDFAPKSEAATETKDAQEANPEEFAPEVFTETQDPLEPQAEVSQEIPEIILDLAAETKIMAVPIDQRNLETLEEAPEIVDLPEIIKAEEVPDQEQEVIAAPIHQEISNPGTELETSERPEIALLDREFSEKVSLEDNNVKPLFTPSNPAPKASMSSKTEIPTQTKQVFQQVTDHVKSIVTNNNPANGDSTTTINLNPGNLGQVSVQIITKENHTEIKLLAKEPETHKLLQEGWKDLVKELETVSSSSDASLSFSLERGNQESQNPAEMFDFFREMSESREGEKALASRTNSVYDSAKGAVLGIYNPEAGKVNLAL